MISLSNLIAENSKVAILGHVHPDGDCIGSCLGLYHYLKKLRPDAEIQIYLESFAEKFDFLKDSGRISHDPGTGEVYDLCFVLDCGDEGRLGDFVTYMTSAKKTVCIDHHVTNSGFADEALVDPKASACSEILYTLMDPGKIPEETAECLYMGIVHDTGVFKHSNTTGKTMTIAGQLLEMGVNSSYIIDHTFYEKTYLQNQILGRILTESILFMNGKCIVGIMRKKTMDFYGAANKDLDGVIDQLRITKGVECAILITETDSMTYKVSMRSGSLVNVAQIAALFGGGGHIRAAGCTMTGTEYDVINNLSDLIAEQFEKAGLSD